MILELDCGNSRVKWRLRDGITIKLRGAFQTQDGFNDITSAELAGQQIARVFVASVLGDEYAKRIAAWSLCCLNINPEFAVSEPSCSGVVNGYDQPEKLGVDRWLGILAAKSKLSVPYLVVDCGSAITVDLVTAQGEHLGGFIAPGLRLLRESLVAKTSAIKLTKIGYPENGFPGRNTVVAVKSAEFAMITGLVDHAKAILRNYDIGEPALWVTGGDGEWLAGVLKSGIYVEDLVLDGLSIALAAQTQVEGVMR